MLVFLQSDPHIFLALLEEGLRVRTASELYGQLVSYLKVKTIL